MKAVLTRNQWYHCIVELSKADALPKALDAIRDKLTESSAPMDSEMAVVLSKGNVESIGRVVGGRIGEALNGQIGNHQEPEGT